MGYYSNFEVTSDDGLFDLVHKEGILSYAQYLSFYDIKWYNMKEDMKAYSTSYPNTLFCVYQEGEDNEDMVHYYFKNGKMQICPAIITFDKFDESKLV